MMRFPDPASGSVRRWAIFVTGSLNFVLSMFYRVSVAVISPALVKELGLSSGQLSDLSAAFFYAFALSQTPIGLALDRLGCRITMSILAVVGVGGGVLFSLGTTPTLLILGRVLLGIGMGGNFMVVLTLLAAWFPVDRFGLLSGLVVSVGVVGNLLAATPLAFMTLHLGWRQSFLIFAVVDLVAVTAFLLAIRDRPAGQPAPAREKEPLFAGFSRMLRMYSYWSISLANFVRYGFFAALQGLWAGPFLIYGLGMGEIAASNGLLFLGLGYMVGLPLSGSLSDRVFRSRKRVALSSLVALCLVTIFARQCTPATSVWLVYLAFFGLGFFAGPGQILYAHMKELLPASMVAQALTAVNLFTMLGGGVMTHIIGSVIGSDPGSLSGPQDFCGLWYVGTAALVIVSALYSLVPDSRALRSEC
jgi:sugar phosphate permease